MSITYRPYAGPSDLPAIMHLVETELSEPYVIYTYRYFLNGWPHLAFVAEAPVEDDTPADPADPADPSSSPSSSKIQPKAQNLQPVGCIVSKQDPHGPAQVSRGYIAMLSVSPLFRRLGIGARLVELSVQAMHSAGADEVMLETEYDNASALRLYESLGFIREKRLFRFYLNGKDAFRLVLAGAEVEPVGRARASGRGTKGPIVLGRERQEVSRAEEKEKESGEGRRKVEGVEEGAVT